MDTRYQYLQAVNSAALFVPPERLSEWNQCRYDTGLVIYEGRELVAYRGGRTKDRVLGTLTCKGIGIDSGDGVSLTFASNVPGLPHTLKVNHEPFRLAEGVWLFVPVQGQFRRSPCTGKWGVTLQLKQTCSANYLGNSTLVRVHALKDFNARSQNVNN